MRDAQAQPRSPGFRNLTPQEAAQRTDLRIVDVRQIEELYGNLGHIPTATHVPMDLLLSGGPPADWSREEPLLIVCRSGARSAHVAMQLAALGFREVYNLAGGMVGWNAAGLPTTRPQAPASGFRLASLFG